ISFLGINACSISAYLYLVLDSFVVLVAVPVLNIILDSFFYLSFLLNHLVMVHILLTYYLFLQRYFFLNLVLTLLLIFLNALILFLYSLYVALHFRKVGLNYRMRFQYAHLLYLIHHLSLVFPYLYQLRLY